MKSRSIQLRLHLIRCEEKLKWLARLRQPLRQSLKDGTPRRAQLLRSKGIVKANSAPRRHLRNHSQRCLKCRAGQIRHHSQPPEKRGPVQIKSRLCQSLTQIRVLKVQRHIRQALRRGNPRRLHHPPLPLLRSRKVHLEHPQRRMRIPKRKGIQARAQNGVLAHAHMYRFAQPVLGKSTPRRHKRPKVSRHRMHRPFQVARIATTQQKQRQRILQNPRIFHQLVRRPANRHPQRRLACFPASHHVESTSSARASLWRRTMMPMTWIVWALLAALFAAATALLAKVGVAHIDSNLATAVRTSVVLVFTWAIAIGLGKHGELRLLDRRSILFLTLSGLATGLSWLCYFRALQLGPASRVAPLDKLSVPLVMLFAWLLLGEKMDTAAIVGGLLITIGAVVMVLS